MQTTKQSMIETITSTAVGYGVSVISNLIVMPAFGYHMTGTDSVAIALIFTAISLARGFILRRVFNRLHG